MGANRTSFAKLQRDRAKKAKAEAKRARRQGKTPPGAIAVDDDPPDTGIDPDNDPTSVEEIDELAEISPADLLTMVETLHEQFESKAIDFDEFEERKAALMARLTVD